MTLQKRVLSIFILGTMLISTAVFAEAKGLFVELSSDDLFKVRRAFMVGTMVRQTQKIPVTVNISLGPTKYVNKGLPLAKMAKLREQSVHDLMTVFMEAGGEIMVCPMCIQGYGLSKEDVLEGIKIGGPDTTLPRMLEDGVKTLSF